MTAAALQAALERHAMQLRVRARRADAERKTVRQALRRLERGDAPAAVLADLHAAGVHLPGGAPSPSPTKGLRTMLKTLSAALLSSLLLAGPASATLQLSASFDGGAAVFAIDNSGVNTCGAIAVGCQLPDQDPAIGTLTLNPTSAGAGGGLSIQGTVQTSDKASVPGTINRLDSTGTQVTATSGTHTFAVVVSDTNFIGPVTSATTTGAGQWSHLGGGYGTTDIAMTWWNDPANAQGADDPFDTPGLLVDSFATSPALLGGANPVSFSHTGGPFAVNDPDLFSMSLAFTGTLAEGVRLTGREMTELKELVAVPSPRSGLLLAMGALLLGAGLVRRGAR
jgi:hypothetical protein